MLSHHHSLLTSKSSELSRDNKNIQQRIILSILSFVLLLIHYFFISMQATVSMWGEAFLYFDTISNVQFFYIIFFLGNLLVLLSALLKYFTSSIHQKKVFLLGISLYWVAIFSYFDFLFFEPFVVLYALILMSFYLNITPVLMPSYDGYILIPERTYFHTNTKLMLGNMVETGFVDILFIVLFIIAFYALKNLFDDENRLISEDSSSKIEFLTKDLIKS